MTIEIQTGVGRIVWGNPGRAQIKKHQDGQLKGQPVLKDGQPVQQWAFGVAFPKADFQTTIWPPWRKRRRAAIRKASRRASLGNMLTATASIARVKPFNQREGYAGCFVLTISTEAFAPPIYKLENGAYRQMKPEEIKTGDYVALALSLKVNVATGTNTPSLYINPVAIEHVGYGQEIQSVGAVDPNAVFGGQQRALPPGASATPLAPAAGTGMPGTMPGMMPPPAPMAPPAPGMMPVAPPMMAPPAPAWHRRPRLPPARRDRPTRRISRRTGAAASYGGTARLGFRALPLRRRSRRPHRALWRTLAACPALPANAGHDAPPMI
jgi:hypothetical protein